MSYISHGDFYFPFTFPYYWIKHYYMWSFQSGTPNPDGVTRLPGRIFNFLAFLLGGNLAASYVYITLTFVVAFFSFYIFCRQFIKIDKKSVAVVASLFFAFNPIFFGNLAKAGLVLAAALLPLILVLLKKTFEQERTRYLLLCIVLINISFLHPYTFAINFGLAFLYFMFQAFRHCDFIKKSLLKLVCVAFIGIGLNAYFVLPIASMGTVSKDAISDNATPIQADYTALVDVSNTGDIFTGLSLSKSVFIDFDFYGGAYANIYYLSVYGFFALITLFYIKEQKELRRDDRIFLLVSVALLLIFVSLAATKVFGIDRLIKFLIQMPGGWAFRSPLKWQFYIPFVLFGIFALLLSRLKPKERRTYTIVALVLFVGMNSYIVHNIYVNLLKPKQVTTFAALQGMDMNEKTLLYINSQACINYNRKNSRIFTELNQVLQSKNVQVKRILDSRMEAINPGSYNFVLACKENISSIADTYHLQKDSSYDNGSFVLYKSPQSIGFVQSADKIYTIDDRQNINFLQRFIYDYNKKPFNFVKLSTESTVPATYLSNMFNDLSPDDLSPGKVKMSNKVVANAKYNLLTKNGSGPVYYTYTNNDGDLVLSSSATTGSSQPTLDANNKNYLSVDVSTGPTNTLTTTYLDDGFRNENLVSNPSFESGAWQRKVDDCYNYDADPAIRMSLSKDNSNDGKMSLELGAQRHIACTGPGDVVVEPGQSYMLSFDYYSHNAQDAGYFIGTPDKDLDTIDRMSGKPNAWNSFSKVVTIPQNQTSLSFRLYAFPAANQVSYSRVNFDNVKLVKLPPIVNRFFLMQDGPSDIQTPGKTTHYSVNPTKKLIDISGAKNPFYLLTNDTYSNLWQLNPSGQKSSVQSFRLNGTMQAWYVDPEAYCKNKMAKCTGTGTYDMKFAISFIPQKWLYIGLFVSFISVVAGIVYYVVERRAEKHNKPKRK